MVAPRVSPSGPLVSTAATPTLAEVLAAGNNAGGEQIIGLSLPTLPANVTTVGWVQGEIAGSVPSLVAAALAELEAEKTLNIANIVMQSGIGGSFGVLQFPQMSGAPVWRAGAAAVGAFLRLEPMDVASHWSFNTSTGALTYNGTEAFKAVYSINGLMQCSLSLGGNPVPPAVIFQYGLDVNGDLVGLAGNVYVKGNLIVPANTFATEPSPPPAFRVNPVLFAFKRTLTIHPGDILTIANVSYDVGAVKVIPELQVTISVNPL